MRFAALILLTALLFACSKERSTASKVEGSWHYYKLLKDDGTVLQKDIDYTFSEASGTRKSLGGELRCYIPSEDTTISGQFAIAEKGTKVVFVFGSAADTGRIEDIDKKSMVLTTLEGIRFFKRK
jgi:hypothetical protein